LEHNVKKAIGAAFAALILAASAVVGLIVMHGQLDQLRGQEAKAKAAVQQLNAAEIATATQLDGLTQPTDPLSAYDQICQVQEQNGTTGVDQTYYYPCTNSAQTIPQPGN
jgi:hypothetical protein